MDKEIQEMGKFACVVCEMCGTDEKGGFRCIAGMNQDTCGLCRVLGKSLYDAGYRNVKPVIIKINDKVEVHCDTMEDYDEFLKVEKQSVEEEKFQVYKNIWNTNYQNMVVGRQWKL